MGTMLDSNGIEMATGMVVEIKNAYFKNDNGLYLITHTPGDESWCGSDYGLKRIKRNGEPAKTNPVAFWPLCSFTSDRFKNASADKWNKENATITVKNLKSNEHLISFFTKNLEELKERKKYTEWNWGDGHPEVKRLENTIEHYRRVINSLS